MICFSSQAREKPPFTSIFAHSFPQCSLSANIVAIGALVTFHSTNIKDSLIIEERKVVGNDAQLNGNGRAFHESSILSDQNLYQCICCKLEEHENLYSLKYS